MRPAPRSAMSLDVQKRLVEQVSVTDDANSSRLLNYQQPIRSIAGALDIDRAAEPADE